MASASILLVAFGTVSLLRKLKTVHEPNLDPFSKDVEGALQECCVGSSIQSMLVGWTGLNIIE